MRAAELKAVAQSAQVGMAEADLYPAFSLGGVLGTVASSTNGSSLSKLFTAPSIAFAFGPSFSWPILNYGQITNNVRAQDAELQALLINYKNTVLGAQREVEDGLSGFVQGRRQVGYLRQSVAAASNALTVALAQYQLGSRDFTTVLTAEQNLYHGAEQSGRGRRQCLGQPDHGLSRARRRLANPVGTGFRPRFGPRRDARPHQLGRTAPARRPESAADARAPRPV